MARRRRPETEFERLVREAWEREQLRTDPACWSWPVPDDFAVLHVEDVKIYAQFGQPFEPGPFEHLRAWQADRCGLCGRRSQVLDHDHETGMARGWLCTPCNLAEGHDLGKPLFGNWRARPAVAVLGVSFRYRNAVRGLDPGAGPALPDDLDHSPVHLLGALLDGAPA